MREVDLGPLAEFRFPLLKLRLDNRETLVRLFALLLRVAKLAMERSQLRFESADFALRRGALLLKGGGLLLNLGKALCGSSGISLEIFRVRLLSRALGEKLLQCGLRRGGLSRDGRHAGADRLLLVTRGVDGLLGLGAAGFNGIEKSGGLVGLLLCLDEAGLLCLRALGKFRGLRSLGLLPIGQIGKLAPQFLAFLAEFNNLLLLAITLFLDFLQRGLRCLEACLDVSQLGGPLLGGFNLDVEALEAGIRGGCLALLCCEGSNEHLNLAAQSSELLVLQGTLLLDLTQRQGDGVALGLQGDELLAQGVEVGPEGDKLGLRLRLVLIDVAEDGLFLRDLAGEHVEFFLRRVNLALGVGEVRNLLLNFKALLLGNGKSVLGSSEVRARLCQGAGGGVRLLPAGGHELLLGSFLFGQLDEQGIQRCLTGGKGKNVGVALADVLEDAVKLASLLFRLLRERGQLDRGGVLLLLRISELLARFGKLRLSVLEVGQSLLQVGPARLEADDAGSELVALDLTSGDGLVNLGTAGDKLLLRVSGLRVKSVEAIVRLLLAALETLDAFFDGGALLVERLHQGVLRGALLSESGDFILLRLTLLAESDERSLNTGALLIHSVEGAGGVLQA